MYKKALVPLDGSELAECALSHVRKLVREGAIGEVILIGIAGVELPWEEMERGVDFSAVRQKVLDASEVYLASVQGRLAREGISVAIEAVEAVRPSQAIVDYARRNGVDLIVLATHGYSGLQKFLLGSVAFKILHESPVPVLLIRPESCLTEESSSAATL